MSSDEALEATTARRSGDLWFFAAGIALVVFSLRSGGSGYELIFLVFAALPAYAAWAGVCLAEQRGRRRTVVYAVFPAVVVLMAAGLLMSFSPYARLLLVFPCMAYAVGYVTGHARSHSGHLLPSLLCAAAVLIALAAFAGTGVSISVSGFSVFAFPSVTGLALWLTQKRPSPVGARLLLAVALGFSATWLGVAWNVQEYDGSRPSLESGYESWLEEHGASKAHYATRAVTGFPIQAIEGHGSGGAPEWLPPGKGLGALIANFLLCTAAFVAVAAKTPNLLLWPTSWVALGLAALCGLLGFFELVWLLD